MLLQTKKEQGHSIYHDNVTLAGKTGTAEIKQSQVIQQEQNLVGLQ